MGGIPSCKCNKDCDTAEISLKTEGELNMKPKDILLNDVDINENIKTKVNKKFNLSALNISDNDLLKIDQKTIIKNFFGRSDNSINFSPLRNNTIDKSTSSVSEEDKINQSQIQAGKGLDKISGNIKKTPPLEIINEVNTEDNIQDYLHKHSAKKPTYNNRKFYSNNSLNEIKNRSSSNLPRCEVNPNPFKKKENEISIQKHHVEDNLNIESKKFSGADGNTSIKNENSCIIQKGAFRLNTKGSKIHDTWKNIDISGILNEKKIVNLTENEMIFQSEIYKYNIPSNHNSQPYINKFLVLTKTELLYYKSKESFLRCQNPLFRIGISSIIQCNRVEVEGNETCKKFKLQSKFHHFYLYFTHAVPDSNQSYLSPNNSTNQSFSKNTSRLNIPNKDTAKKISLISGKSNESYDNNVSKYTMNTRLKENLGSQLTIVFASNNEELINKWVGIMNHMLKQ